MISYNNSIVRDFRALPYEEQTVQKLVKFDAGVTRARDFATLNAGLSPDAWETTGIHCHHDLVISRTIKISDYLVDPTYRDV